MKNDPMFRCEDTEVGQVVSDRKQVLEPLACLDASGRGLDERECLDLSIDFERQQAVPNHRGGDANVTRLAVGQPDVNPLKIRLERATADAGRFLADAAQVLCLATIGLVIAEG